MASEQNTNNQEIDIRRIFLVCLQHWYWFLIGLALCGGLGVLYYLRTTPQFQTEAAIMLRQKNDTQLFSGATSGALDMLGISMNGAVEDEVQVLMSRDLMHQLLMHSIYGRVLIIRMVCAGKVSSRVQLSA